MKVILLEIDAAKKRMLLSKLFSAGFLAMKTCKGNKKEACLSSGGSSVGENEVSIKASRVRVEIYAEKYSISRIIKTLVKLARDGFLVNSPVKVISIRSAI